MAKKHAHFFMHSEVVVDPDGTNPVRRWYCPCGAYHDVVEFEVKD